MANGLKNLAQMDTHLGRRGCYATPASLVKIRSVYILRRSHLANVVTAAIRMLWSMRETRWQAVLLYGWPQEHFRPIRALWLRWSHIDTGHEMPELIDIDVRVCARLRRGGGWNHRGRLRTQGGAGLTAWDRTAAGLC